MIRNIKYLLWKKGMLPIYLIFDITYRCNSRCLTCFAWRDIEERDKREELKLEEVKKVSLGLKKIEWLLLSGGEPFLREDIDEVCKIFYKQNKTRRITIPTNGLLPLVIKNKTEEIFKKCNKAKIIVSISVDGIKERHDEIRGVKGNFDKLIETYKHLVDLKKDYRNLCINLNTVISNKNIDNIKEIMDHILDNMPAIDFHGFELLRGYPRDKGFTTPSWQEYEETLGCIKEYWKNFKFYNIPFARLVRNSKILARELEFGTLKKGERMFNCYAGWIAGVISAYGDVQLCELLPTIGNLKGVDYSFKKVWFNEKAEKQRKMVKQAEGVCRNCTHSCFVASSILFDPIMLSKIFFKVFMNSN